MRSPSDEAKVGHLRLLPQAGEKLELVGADMTAEAYTQAFGGCSVGSRSSYSSSPSSPSTTSSLSSSSPLIAFSSPPHLLSRPLSCSPLTHPILSSSQVLSQAAIHLATPYFYTSPDPETEIVKPAVNGTSNLTLFSLLSSPPPQVLWPPCRPPSTASSSASSSARRAVL